MALSAAKIATKVALEKFFYTAGTNIALYNASRTKEYKNLQLKLEIHIKKQLQPFADKDMVARLFATSNPKEVVDANFKPMIDYEDFLVFMGDFGGQQAYNKLLRHRIKAEATPIVIITSFKLTNPEVTKKLRERARWSQMKVDATTKQWILDQVAMGYENGLTVEETAEMIYEKYPGISEMRAEMIVFTETQYAINQVEMEMYNRSGLTQHEWVTSHDERVELVCLENEAQGAIPIGEPFGSGDISPPAHPRCRCFLDAVLPKTDKELDDFFDRIWLGV